MRKYASKILDGIPLFELSILLSMLLFAGGILFIGTYPMEITQVTHVDDGVVDSTDAGDVVVFESLSEHEQNVVERAIQDSNVANGTTKEFFERIVVPESGWDSTNESVAMNTHYDRSSLTVVYEEEMYLLSYAPVFSLLWIVGLAGVSVSIIVASAIIQSKRVKKEWVGYNETFFEIVAFGVTAALVAHFFTFILFLEAGPTVYGWFAQFL